MNILSQSNLQIRGGSRATPTQRQQWLERFRHSGLSQAAFASAQGLKLSTLRYWLYHLPPVPRPASPALRLQEIHVDGGWPAAPDWEAEIALPDGRRIRLRSALARELVAPLLEKR
jgi:hypothetical protein